MKLTRPADWDRNSIVSQHKGGWRKILMRWKWHLFSSHPVGSAATTSNTHWHPFALLYITHDTPPSPEEASRAPLLGLSSVRDMKSCSVNACKARSACLGSMLCSSAPMNLVICEEEWGKTLPKSLSCIVQRKKRKNFWSFKQGKVEGRNYWRVGNSTLGFQFLFCLLLFALTCHPLFSWFLLANTCFSLEVITSFSF